MAIGQEQIQTAPSLIRWVTRIEVIGSLPATDGGMANGTFGQARKTLAASGMDNGVVGRLGQLKSSTISTQDSSSIGTSEGGAGGSGDEKNCSMAD